MNESRNESRRTWVSRVTYKRVMSHILGVAGWRVVLPSGGGEGEGTETNPEFFSSHVSQVNESCFSSEWVMSNVNESVRVHESCNIWMSHVSQGNEACEWVMSHKGVTHVSQVSASCPASEWVMSRKWVSHVPQVSESCPASEWVMSRKWVSHVSQVNESCLASEWVMSRKWMSPVSASYLAYE